MGGCFDCCVRNCCIIDNVFTRIGGEVRDAIRDIFRGDSGGCTCDTYRPSRNTTEKHTTKIANELASMKEKKRAFWDKKEGEIIDHINGNMNGLIEELEKLNLMDFEGKSLNIDLTAIRSKTEEIKNKVTGSVGRVFEDRLVTTDPELSVIMNERSDKKRSMAFNGFCKKIQKSALTTLKNNISNSIKEQNELIKSVISTRMEEVNASIQQENEAYKALIESKEKEEANAKMQLMHIYLNELAALLSHLSEDK